VVEIGYIFKPKKIMTDRVARVVKYMQAQGINMNVSKIYKYAVQRILFEYDVSREDFLAKYRTYEEKMDADF
jgi:nucleoside diphosphate kinase